MKKTTYPVTLCISVLRF